MNSVILLGRLTKDPEVRYTNSNMAVARFSLAIDRPAKDGEKKADFPNIVVFGKQAENCERYLHKGQRAAVEGRLQTGSYERQDGSRVYTTDVVANRVEFIDWKTDDLSDKNTYDDKQHENAENTADIERQSHTADVPTGFEALDDDIPF